MIHISITKKRLFVLIYFTLLFFFILWLFFSNSIIMSFSPNQLYKDNLQNYKTKDFVYYAVDEVDIYNDLGENVKIQGWAFVDLKGERDNQNKIIKLLFVSPDKCYSTEVQWPKNVKIPIFWPFERNDLKDLFPNMYFGSQASGFVGEFSTLSMKDNFYKLYIYCYENENYYGLVDTKRTFQKDGSKFIFVSDESVK